MKLWRIRYHYLDTRGYPVSLTAHIHERTAEKALDRGWSLMGLPQRAAVSVERES